LNLVFCFLPAISDFFLKTVSDHSKASVLAPTVDLTLIAFCGGPIGSLSAFLVGVLAPAGLTLSRAQCLKNYTAGAQCLICADGPPLLRRCLVPGILTGELRSLKRPCFLKRHAVSLELLKDTAADVLCLGLKKGNQAASLDWLSGSMPRARIPVMMS
jgi:hypothetical protein